ncbi:MAG: hypothetical protein ACR2JV_00080 [Gaiellales bacterium]
MPRPALLVVLALLAAVLAGCGMKAEPTGAIDPYPTHAVDASGQPVSVTAEPTRIVSADPGASAVLRDLGLGSVVVVAMPAGVGTAAADPTTALVVVPLSLDDAALQQLGRATAAPIFRYGADPLSSAPTVVTQLGIAVGRGPAAATVAQAMAAGFATLADRLHDETAVRTLIEGAGFTAFGPATPAGLAVAAAGGENVVPGDTQLDPARIRGLDVAAWVALQPGGSTIASLQGFPELATVPALEANRVIPMPADGYPIDAALPQALQALADDLHAAPVASG